MKWRAQAERYISAARDKVTSRTSTHQPADSSDESEAAAAHKRGEELLHSGEAQRALIAIAQASALLPDDPALARRHVQVARAIGDFDEWRIADDKLRRLAPDDPGVHFQRTVLANQQGDAYLYWQSLETAKSLFHQRALTGDVASLCGLLRTYRRDGQQDQVERLLRVVIAHAHRSPSAAAINEAADTLVALGDIRGLGFLADGIDHSKLDEGSCVATADLLIRLERNEQAKAMIAGLNRSTPRQLELRAWAQMQEPDLGQGHVDKARELIAQVSYPNSLSYLRIYDRRLPLQLGAVGPTPPTNDGMPLIITMVKNELSRLDDWYDHYRRLGFERFLAIDNGSTDGTLDYLLAQPDTFVFSSPGDFRRYASGRRWVNHLIETFGNDSWCFVIDADELLVFPNDERGVGQLSERLDADNSQVMFALALDMHADRLTAWEDGDNAQPLGERFPYFDARTRVIGSRHAPYLASCGGLRNHALASLMPENLLTRPLAVKGGTGTHFLSPHLTNPAIPAPITGALLHYKFATNPHDRLGIPSAKGVFMQYLGQDLEGSRSIELTSAHSTRFASAQQLLELGIVRH